MKIKNIVLNNFRSAEQFSLDLDDKLTVLVGINGSGKSSVLDAIAIMLSWLTARIKRDTFSGRPIREIDIKNGTGSAMISINCDKEPLYWALAKTKEGRKEQYKKDLGSLNPYAESLRNHFEQSGEAFAIPVYAYYPVNRAVVDVPLKIKGKHEFGIFSIYNDALTSDANFRVFFEWFREREDIENEEYRRKQDIFNDSKECNFPDKQLEAVRYALSKFLPEYKNFSIKRSPLRMVVDKAGEQLRIDNLSDGEKGLIALIGDIARRLAIANPAKNDPLDGEGVVLIDEIDLHLHPAWQRMVVPKLCEVFPNIQFVISTHSPQVLSEVEAKHLRILTNEGNKLGFYIPKQSFGLTSLEILQEIMGDPGRNVQIKDEIKEVFELIDKDKFQEANAKIADIKEKTNGDIPELIEAESTIAMLN